MTIIILFRDGNKMVLENVSVVTYRGDSSASLDIHFWDSQPSLPLAINDILLMNIIERERK